MRAFIGKTYNGDVSSTMKIFNWKPISFEKTVLDTAKSIKGFFLVDLSVPISNFF